jgi:hypothetical protein
MQTGWHARIRSFHFQRYRKIIFQAHSNIKALTPYFSDFDNIGNYLWEYPGLIDLAVYRALVKEGIDPDYAMDLVGDMIWQARVNAKGLIPIIDPQIITYNFR